MKKSRIFHLLFAALLCCFAPGCYNRFTYNLRDLKELSSSDSSMIEASAFLETERKATLRSMVNKSRNDSQIYTINAGDILSINVYNNPDLSVSRTIVTTDGCIGMVLVGQLKVSGMTLDQASAALEKKLSQYIRNPKVGISLQEIKSETATISGAINRPGMYTISQGMRLADLLALAGGVASRLYDGQNLDAADFSKSVFIRDGKPLPVNFSKAIEQGDPDDNVPLRKGDYIHIAARDNSMVYLIGDVKSAQRRVLMPNMGLLELVSSCGGINETHWQYAVIIRGGVNKPKLYKVDIDAVLQGRKPNILLESGDIVYIPHDDITEYNVFIHKLFPTVQLINMISTPMFWYTRF